MTTTTEPWATLEIRLQDPGDAGWGEAGERLEALAALLAEDDRALGVETRDMSTLGQQALHPELIVYTRPDALEGLQTATNLLAEQLRLGLQLVPTIRTDDDWHEAKREAMVGRTPATTDFFIGAPLVPAQHPFVSGDTGYEFRSLSVQRITYEQALARFPEDSS